MESPKNSIDIVIIGGGPAGISAALWCSELGLRSVLIEQENTLGGQLRQVYNPINNYPGVSAQNGMEMLSRFEESLGSRNFVRRTGIKVVSIDVDEMEVDLAADGIEVLSCKAMVLASGVRRRLLGVPGEVEFRGKGILESGLKDKALVSGERVLIIGGGDAAFENALVLSEVAGSVSIAYRRNEPTARGEFVDAAKGRENVKLLPTTVVTGIAGDHCVENVELEDPAAGKRTELFDAILIRIGVEPNSDFVRGVLDLDKSGYIKVDHTGRTSAAGVYAVGDVADNYSPTLSTATGTSVTAVKAIYRSLRRERRYNTAQSIGED